MFFFDKETSGDSAEHQATIAEMLNCQVIPFETAIEQRMGFEKSGEL